MSSALQSAWEGLLKGQIPDLNRFTVTKKSLWHRQDVGTALSASYNWFNTAASPYVTNMPQASSLPNEQAMWITGIRIHVARGYDTSGTAQADGLPNQIDADPAAVANDLDLLLSYGQFKLSIAGREYIDAFGLYQFPSGGGVYMDGVAATTATTVTYIDLHPNNGFPDARNLYQLPVPIPLVPGKNISCTTGWNIGPTLKDTYSMCVALDGVFVYPANN